jgi:hypothetical protein
MAVCKCGETVAGPLLTARTQQWPLICRKTRQTFDSHAWPGAKFFIIRCRPQGGEELLLTAASRGRSPASKGDPENSSGVETAA